MFIQPMKHVHSEKSLGGSGSLTGASNLVILGLFRVSRRAGFEGERLSIPCARPNYVGWAIEPLWELKWKTLMKATVHLYMEVVYSTTIYYNILYYTAAGRKFVALVHLCSSCSNLLPP